MGLSKATGSAPSLPKSDVRGSVSYRLTSTSWWMSLFWKMVRFVLLLGLCYIILYPFFIKSVNAFKSLNDFLDPTVRFIPKSFTLNNVIKVISEMDYFTALGNTLLVAVTVSLSQTLISALSGYGLARFAFFGNRFVFALVIFSIIVPPGTIIIPFYLKFRDFLGLFNLLDTPLPIFILSLTGYGLKNGLFIFLFRQFFKNSPRELEEAAALDGCGAWRTFFEVMLPSAKSLIVITLLLSFSWQWTDTVYSSLFLIDFSVLSTAMSRISGSTLPIIASNYQNIGALLAILPLALLYIVAQKFFVQSLDRAGLVG